MTVYDYAFSEDGKPLVEGAMGRSFICLDDAKNIGAKWWQDSIAYYRRPRNSNDEWEFIEGINLLDR
jgi:hypothetical protein